MSRGKLSFRRVGADADKGRTGCPVATRRRDQARARVPADAVRASTLEAWALPAS